MFKNWKFSSLVLGICFLWIIPLFGLKVSPYSSLDYKERPPRPVKHIRPNNNSYRISAPKPKNPSNRVPSHLQDINGAYKSGYSTYISSEPFPASSSDAIRIVDPPKYFQEQKKYYQHNPLYLYSDVNHKEKPYKRNQNPIALALNHRPSEHLHHQHQSDSVLQEESFYRGPEYEPYPQIPFPTKKPQSHINHKPPANNSKPKQQKLTAEQTKLPPTYIGIQTPNSDSIRSQIHSLKEKQRLQFEDEADEHPARPTNSRKRGPTTQRRKPNPKPKEAEGQVLGYEVFQEAEEDYNKLKNTFADKKKKENKTKVLSTESDSSTKDNSSRNKESFVPYQMLASVRHTNRISQQPRPKSTNPRATSRLKTQQSHTVYSEQGFEDVEYDHGDEERHAQHKQRARQKRDIKLSQELIDDVEKLPIALRLADSNGKELKGKELLRQVSQLVKNNSSSHGNNTELDLIFLSSEELEMLLKKTNITIEPDEHDEHDSKFPFEKLDLSTIPNESPINYAEKLENFNESVYAKGDNIDCDEDEEPDLEQNSEKKKLGNLEEKLNCLKTKYFGKDPLGNRFFKDPIINAEAQPLIADNLNYPRVRPSQLDHVYNDVMKTIHQQSERTKKLSRNFDYPMQETAETTERRTIRRLKNRPPSYYSKYFTRLLNDKNPENQMYPPYKLVPATLPPQFLDTSTYQVFDITKFIPKVFVVRSDGKIYGLKIRQPAQRKFEKIQEADVPERYEKHEESEERSEKYKRPEKTVRSEKRERPERSGKLERGERSQKNEKSEKMSRFDSTKRIIDSRKEKQEPKVRQRKRKPLPQEDDDDDNENENERKDLKQDVQKFTHENAMRKRNNDEKPYRVKLLE